LDNGRPTDPVMYLKCFLVGYFEGIECDTDLASRLSDSISIRLFLFGSLSVSPPDHSSLSRVRRTMAERCDWDEVLRCTVNLLRVHGLVGGEAVSIDTSLVPSRAKRGFEEVPESGSQESSAKPREQEEEKGFPPEELRPCPGKPSKKMKPVPSSYDLEAHVGTKPGYVSRPSYKASVATDHLKRAILSADALPASTGEGACARLAVLDLVKTLGECPRHVVADKGMDDCEFHAMVDCFGGSAVTPLQKSSDTASGFSKERFFYDASRDVYVCPAGQNLALLSSPYAKRLIYQAPVSACKECPLKLLCFGSAKGPKRVSRTPEEASRERVIAARKDPERRRLLGQRKSKVEPVFAEFKGYGGLAKIWTKGRACASVKVKAAAVGWNIKILLKHLTGVPAKLHSKTPVAAPPQPLQPPFGVLRAGIDALLELIRSVQRAIAKNSFETHFGTQSL